ncbi:hypothetical protein Btru_033588 [Bulinus truncatus]|nr:hypothetical protein Btru_033588 [Bulinus truncatus]
MDDENTESHMNEETEEMEDQNASNVGELDNEEITEGETIQTYEKLETGEDMQADKENLPEDQDELQPLKDDILTDSEKIKLSDKNQQLDEGELDTNGTYLMNEEEGPDQEDQVVNKEETKQEDESAKLSDVNIDEVSKKNEEMENSLKDLKIDHNLEKLDDKEHENDEEKKNKVDEEINVNFNQNDNEATDQENAIQEYIRKGSLDMGFKTNTDATATVKFVMMPMGQVVTLACTLGQTLEDLKIHFSFELKMPSNLIMLLFDGKTMSDSTTLAQLGVGPNGTIQLEIQSADPLNTPLKQYRSHQEYHMPDVITVRVITEDCEPKDVVVEIERSRTKKPFLGGFRNKNTGVEYHNASAQTMQKQRPLATSERFCRDTQTCEQKNTLQQTFNTTSTQMTGIGCYISNMEDKLLSPKKYTTADEYLENFLNKVIILQKNFRRWIAKRYVKKLKEDKEKRLAWERREELRKKKEKEERIKKEYARRINPQSKSDFDLLLHCLEKWRLDEVERINSTLTEAERKAALCMLLDEETELLSAIERHKNEASLENRQKQIMSFLEKAAAPKKWAGPDGKLTFMDTPYTIRAKELRDIYKSINMKYLTQDERLDVLLTLKHTVKEHDCKLTQEITELIDREADLLMRGVNASNLAGLRKRISTLFLQYIKTPAFNPEAARLLKIPQDPSTLRKNINFCRSCGSYLPSTEFFITSNTSSVGRCKKCEKIENDGRQREDHNYYRVMLKALRKSEEALQDGSSICYLLQEKDLRYLVENIWSNQSVLSAWDDIYDLVLARWDKHQEWSPWNCILLTHDEAEAHKKLFSLEEGYGQVFIHKVTQKHNFARNYFSRLPGMSEVLRKKIEESEKEKPKGPSVAGLSVAKAQKV